MKWYKSLPLVVATSTALLSGCVYSYDVNIRGKVIGKVDFDKVRCVHPLTEGYYSVSLEDENGFVSPLIINGGSCFLSSLEKEIESGDELILKGWKNSGESAIHLQKYKVFKKSKTN